MVKETKQKSVESVVMSDKAVELSHKFVEKTRNYRPSGWVLAWGNARATFLNFDYWWTNTLGNRIVEADMVQKKPPVPLLSLSRLELDTFIAFRETAKKQGIDTSINNAGQGFEYKAHLLSQARVSNPVYVEAHNRAVHHMWHTWGLAPASALSLIAKYIALGAVSGLFAAGIWRYGYHLPERRKIDTYYKSLYAEHPQYWPALAMQKKVRSH